MTSSATELMTAATKVMEALEPLSPEDRQRVLRSAAELYAVGFTPTSASGGARPTPTTPAAPPAPDPSTGGKQLSLVEFLDEKEPATNRQRIAAFAYYREHVEGQGAQFAKADLVGYFATAKIAKPGNYDRDWNNAVREGWIHEDGSSSYLTKTGEDAVKAGFGGKGKPRGPAASKGRAKKASTTK